MNFYHNPTLHQFLRMKEVPFKAELIGATLIIFLGISTDLLIFFYFIGDRKGFERFSPHCNQIFWDGADLFFSQFSQVCHVYIL